MAFMLLLVIVAAGTLLARANRLPTTASADSAARIQLTDLLDILKQQLINQILQEDNTPGSFPCPSGPSCGVSADLASTFNVSGIDKAGASRLSPPAVSNGLCVQYVIAPSVRNNVNTKDRSTDAAQKKLNPYYDPDLTFIDNSGVAAKAWAILLANTSVTTCSLDSLGYQMTVDSTAGTAVVQALAAKPALTTTTASLLIEKRDLLPGMFDQVLMAVDTPAFAAYLQGKTLTQPTSLSTIRSGDSGNFDDALKPAGASLTAGSCPGVQFGASSSSSASASSSAASSSSSAPTNFKYPVSWLCFNDWYGSLKYDPASRILTAQDSNTSLSCTRTSGKTQCSY
ncbi:hypothetical protein VVD49_14880 [Uliginosibacterium sp. H3]|uniref:Uncharacterized protein n=1 Tax=Uliginosibacterium silvisoli TaxID=3114758 RepID=A0ABU6K7Q0_9RHOO|nr:hypothetical protein [Uliginosibacterium sp. H3]